MATTLTQIIEAVRKIDDTRPDQPVEAQVAAVVQLLETFKKEATLEIVDAVITHDKADNLSYCDTGEDMDYYCRSECVDMASDRLLKVLHNSFGIKV